MVTKVGLLTMVPIRGRGGRYLSNYTKEVKAKNINKKIFKKK